MSRWGVGHRSGTGDAGVTVAETVVAMSIMGVVLTAFTSGMIQIYGSVQRTDAAGIAQSQMHAAFARLDRELRYSSGVGTPVQQPGDIHIVEYESTITDTSRCFRLRLDLGRDVLQQRNWQPGNQASMTAWSTVATGVGLITRPGAVAPPPFFLTGSDTTVRFQRLRVRLATTSAGKPREVDVTFTALNTSLTTDSRTICSEGR
jgi:type II secretory pathway pseudopilin PulG